MFGYVKIHKPELKVKEYDIYKAVYCTLCKRLGKSYGHLLRMTLSYDFTFLTMLLLSINNPNIKYKKGKCVYNPLKKCSYTECDSKCDNDVYDYCSAVAVIMMYFKLSDDVRDGNSIKAKLFKALISGKYKKAKLKYPNINDIMLDMEHEQTSAELNDAGIDTAAEPTSKALAQICESAVSDEYKRIVNRVGYCVGKWVYLADALDDLDDDVKYNRFNPIKEVDINVVISNLNVCSCEAGASYELIDDNQFSNIIKNILYLGMPAEINRILNKKGES